MATTNMKIAVLSGKGGTGKTLVSVNLATVANNATYIDCDVEEPNGHLFFKPNNLTTEEIFIKIPDINEKLCTGCRKCIDFCKFNAMVYIKDKVLIFNEICHSCGGCQLLCPQNAITEKDKSIGTVQKGYSENVKILSGLLNIGEASGVPIIKHMLKELDNQEQTIFIDCPPGSSCMVMESIKDADYCILVAEPTIFGVENLCMVYDLVNIFKKPHGVVLNKCLDTNNPAEIFCKENGIKILAKIPFDLELGTLNSNAKIAARENKHYHKMFSSLLQTVTKEVQHETAVNP